MSFSRLYKDRDGNWQDSTRFSREDLPLLMKAADQVHSFLYQRHDGPDPGDERDPGLPTDPFDKT